MKLNLPPGPQVSAKLTPTTQFVRVCTTDGGYRGFWCDEDGKLLICTLVKSGKYNRPATEIYNKITLVVAAVKRYYPSSVQILEGLGQGN